MKMPKNLKQELLFTCLMIPLMVSVMVIYNNTLAHGSIFNVSLWSLLREMLVMSMIAFVVEFPIIAPLAHTIAFKIIDPRTCKPIMIPVTISCCTVCMMCPFMSLMANLVLFNNAGRIMEVWPHMAAINFPVALSWQLFVAGPVVRKSFAMLMEQRWAQAKLN